MENSQESELRDYANLARTNAENALVSAMFGSMVRNSPAIDRFSTFLLLGTGATASLFVTNLDKLIPVISVFGFKISGLLLVASGLFGLVAKFRAIQCEISTTNQTMMDQTFPVILSELDKHQETIATREGQLGISVDKEFRISRVIEEFLKPMPRMAGIIANRVLRKNDLHPQLAYLMPVKAWIGQSSFTFLQAVFFVAFVLSCLCFV